MHDAASHGYVTPFFCVRPTALSFRDVATFTNHRCDEGAAVANGGQMRQVSSLLARSARQIDVSEGTLISTLCFTNGALVYCNDYVISDGSHAPPPFGSTVFRTTASTERHTSTTTKTSANGAGA